MLLLFPMFIAAQQSYTIDIHKGLTTNNITDLTFDSRGNLWIGSYNGLMKHEGGRITKFTKVGKDENSLSSLEMHSIIEDKCGNIWIATTNGVDILDPITHKFQHIYPKSPRDGSTYIGYIYWIFQDEEEFIWISTDVGIFKIDNISHACIKVPETNDKNGIPNQYVSYNGAVSTIDGLWINTNDGLAYYEYATKQFHHKGHNPKNLSPFNNKIKQAGNESDLRMDKSDKLWFIQDLHYLASYDIKKNKLDTFRLEFPQDTWFCCKSLAVDDDENIWIGSRHGGFIIFNKKDFTFKNYTFNGVNSMIPSNYIHAIENGPNGQMFISTSQGLSIIEYNNFIFKEKLLSGEPEFINMKYQSGDISFDPFRNSIFIPFYKYGFIEHIIDADTFIYENNGKEMSSTLFIPINSRYSYLARGKIFNKYDHNKKTIEKTNYPIKGLDTIGGDIIWYEKTISGFIAKKNRGTLLHFTNGNLNLYDGVGFKAMASYNKNKDEIWYLNGKPNLVKVNATTGLRTEVDIQKLLANKGFSFSIQRKILDDGNNIWMTSHNGVLKYNIIQDTLETYSVNEGLSHSFVFSITMDSLGTVWTSSLNGIDAYDSKANKFIKVLPIKNTTYMDAFGHSLCTPDGNLFFHYGNKLISINSKKYHKSNTQSKSLILSSILINDKYISIDNKRLNKLNSNENNIKINFAIRDFINPELAKYEYKINDGNWNDNGNNTEINFKELNSGKYKLEIKAYDHKGTKTENNVQLTFSIEPLYYKTAWFYLLLSFFAIGISYLFFRKRIKVIQEQKNISVQMAELRATALKAQMNPHFIFNSLNAIQESIITNNTDKAYDYLSKFSKFLRKVLNYSDVQNISIHDEVELMKLYVEIESLRFVQGIDFNINIDEEIEAEVELIPTMIIQPFIENCIWHGLRSKVRDKNIWLNITQRSEAINVEIIDNGIGIENSKLTIETKNKSKEHQSKGISITTQRIKNLYHKNAIEVNIKIENAFDVDEFKGTKVSFSYPKINPKIQTK